MKRIVEKEAPGDILAFQEALEEWVDSLDPESAADFMNADVKIDEAHTLKRKELIAKALSGIVRFEPSLKGKHEALRLAKQFLNIT